MKRFFWENRFLNSGAVLNRNNIKKMYRVIPPKSESYNIEKESKNKRKISKETQKKKESN